MKVQKIGLACVMSISLFLGGGCASKIQQGKVVSDAHLAGMIPGVTSYNDAIKLLGTPDSVFSKDNKIIATWRSGEVETYGVSVPGSSTLIGTDSNKGEFKKVSLIFDDKTMKYRTYSKNTEEFLLKES
jgi:hypothetical protein